MLGRLLQRSPAQVGVVAAPPAALVGQLGAGVSAALLAELAAPLATTAPVATTAASTRSVRRELQQATAARRHELLLAYVREQAGRVLGLHAADLADRSPLSDLGLDSLMAVELRNSLGAGLELERELPATLVFDFPTIAAIVVFLGRELFDDGSVAASIAPPGPPAASADHADADSALDAIEELSDDDVERLLAERASANLQPG